MDVIGIKDITIETGKDSYKIKSEKDISIPSWLALFLEEEGIVKIKSYDNKYFQILILEEKKDKKLNLLDEDFYELAEITLEKADPQHRKKLAISLKELIDLRMRKLMQLAMQGAEIKIPHREKILYNKIREEIKNWFADTEGMFNGDRV
jgi:hypothetical protein